MIRTWEGQVLYLDRAEQPIAAPKQAAPPLLVRSHGAGSVGDAPAAEDVDADLAGDEVVDLEALAAEIEGVDDDDISWE